LVAVWDDHEIVNDAGPHQAASATAPGVDLLPPALRAFLEYQPLQPSADDPQWISHELIAGPLIAGIASRHSHVARRSATAHSAQVIKGTSSR
jgi:hypothetical protein